MNRSWTAAGSSSDFFAGFSDGDMDTPNEIVGQLALWSLLYDVPFPYLVPNAKMLPSESIRFFHLNHDFIFALLDGALSLGRSFEVDYQHDALLIETVMGRAFSQRKRIRPHLQRKPEPDSQADDSTGMGSWASTGFLLRSGLVKGWRGLEFSAFDEQNNVLDILRLEVLGPEILLGIFVGTCVRLDIAQPPEGMHFGCEAVQEGHSKRLRQLDSGKLYEDIKMTADVVEKKGSHRVVDWVATAASISTKLSAGELGSAHIALEMIQNPAIGSIARK